MKSKISLTVPVKAEKKNLEGVFAQGKNGSVLCFKYHIHVRLFFGNL